MKGAAGEVRVRFATPPFSIAENFKFFFSPVNFVLLYLIFYFISENITILRL